MEKNKKVLAGIIIGLIVIVGIVLYLVFKPPEYHEVLIKAMQLMEQNPNTTINYYVRYETSFSDEVIEGQATYKKVMDEEEWNVSIINNSIEDLTDTLYSVNPVELFDFITYSEISEVEDYTGNISCYLLNSLVMESVLYDMLIPTYDYARVMVCLDKETGYPHQYTIMVVGDLARQVTYNALTIRRLATPDAEPPAEINETLAERVDPEVMGEALEGFEDLDPELVAEIEAELRSELEQ